MVLNFLGDDRVLITGATGWFGRTALWMAMKENVNVLAMASKKNSVRVGEFSKGVYAHNLEQIADFAPTVFVDSAFLTRDKISAFDLGGYISLNRSLIRDSIEIASLPSIRKYVGFSSGATRHLAGQESFALQNNPYAALKMEYEAEMAQINSSNEVAISIARVWSVTGPFTTKPDLFAFSNLISQAREGLMRIESAGNVFRRYCGLEAVMQVALAQKKQGGDPVFDTGGELIEIGDLAQVIREEINNEAVVIRGSYDGSREDNYYSDGTQWDSMIADLGLLQESIRSQIRRSTNFD